jgi:hypothetical protein
MIGLVVFGFVVVLMVVVITAIAQPPNKWVEWFTGKKDDPKG